MRNKVVMAMQGFSRVLFLALALALAAAVASVSGCMHVRISARDLLAPDQPPAAARLAAGFVIEESLLQRGERVVGITRAHRDGNRAVIVFCGGDGFHRSSEGGSVLQALAHGADVVLFDYPGFGASSGSADADSILDNARAAEEYVSRLPSSSGQKRVLYGFSLGGVVAAQLAGERPVDGLVLEATAPDIARWARTQVPWFAKPFVRVDLDPALARIDNVRALAKFRGKVLVLAGTNDAKAPPALSRDMTQRLKAEGVRAELRVVPSAGHGEIYKSPGFRADLERFLAGL